MSNLIKPNFWFSTDPVSLSPLFQKILLLAVILFLIGTIVAKVFSKIDKNKLYRPAWQKTYNFFLSNFIISLLLTFFNYESIPFFSMRFWYLAWLVEIAIWLFLIGRDLARIPARKQQLDKEAEYKKYIP